MPSTYARVTRAAIKEYFKRRLLDQSSGAFPTLAGGRIYLNRNGPLQDEEMPCISIYVQDEACTEIDTNADRRALKLNVELQASGDDTDTQLDVLSDQVYDLFRNDEYLGGHPDGLVEKCRYVRGQLYFDERRHFNGYSWLMEYDVTYIDRTNPDPELSNLTRFAGANVSTPIDQFSGRIDTQS